MNDQAIVITLLLIRIVPHYYHSRSERVARNLLLFATDADPIEIVRRILPTASVHAAWISRIFLYGAVFSAWRAWQWIGVSGVLLFAFLWFYCHIILDILPWPGHRKLLERIKRRVASGRARIDTDLADRLTASTLMIYVFLDAGESFEQATVHRVWERRRLQEEG